MKEPPRTADEIKDHWRKTGLLEGLSGPLQRALAFALESQLRLDFDPENSLECEAFNRLAYPCLVRAFMKIDKVNLLGIDKNFGKEASDLDREVLYWKTDAVFPQHYNDIPSTLDREQQNAAEFGNTLFSQIDLLCERHSGEYIAIRGISLDPEGFLVVYFSL